MLKLESREDLQKLVDEGFEESLTLDYKASEGLARTNVAVNELCKDVSAFANSAGGQIVYGIVEAKRKGKPERVDDGVTDPKITREWIEQILNSRVQPRMQGVRIERIALGENGFGYVITVPATEIGPHQAPDLKYYRRFELQSVAMHDYEIRDVMRRKATPQPFVTLSFALGDRKAKLTFDPGAEASKPVPIVAYVSNRTSEPAMFTQVTLGIDDDFVLASAGSYKNLGSQRTDNGRVNVLRQMWPVTQRMPIFKEATFNLADEPFWVAVRSQHLNDTRFFIAVGIQTPGFVSSETWYVRCHGGQLTILPPIAE